MPSHFHSTSQSPRSPSSAAIAAASVSVLSIGEARQNGYGRERSAAVTPGDTTPANHDADGVHSPMSRAAMDVAGRSDAWATARTTSVCETPRRSSPVSSLNSVKRSQRPSSRIQPMTRRCCASGGACRSGRMRPSTHSDRPSGSAGTVPTWSSISVAVSAPSPTTA